MLCNCPVRISLFVLIKKSKPQGFAFFIGAEGEIRSSRDKSRSTRTRASQQSTGLLLLLRNCPVRISFINKKSKPQGFALFIGAEGGIRTLAAVSHPTPLAGAPRHQLEYFCKTDYLTHTVKFSTVRCVNNITKLFLKVNMKCYIILILFS